MSVLIAGVPADRWSAATPCDAWNVRDLITHVIAGNVKYRGIGLGDDFVPGAPEVDLGDEPAETYRTSLSEMLDAWRQPDSLEREIGLPRGQRGRAEIALWIHLAETLAHGWDLATATDQKPGFDDDLVAASLDECQRRVPAERGEESPFANAVTKPGGSLIDQFAAYLGRNVALA